jgi:hypothetical protein
MFNDQRFIADDDDFDPVTGLLKDGHSIRVRMTMMDGRKRLDTADVIAARKVTEAVLATQAAMQCDGFITDAVAALHRPGYRFADQSLEASFGTGYRDPGPGGDLPPLGTSRRRPRRKQLDPQGTITETESSEAGDAAMSDAERAWRDCVQATATAWMPKDVKPPTGAGAPALTQMQPVGS